MVCKIWIIKMLIVLSVLTIFEWLAFPALTNSAADIKVDPKLTDIPIDIHFPTDIKVPVEVEKPIDIKQQSQINPIDIRFKPFEIDSVLLIKRAAVRWGSFIGAKVSTPPVVSAEGTIYLAAENKMLYAVNTDGSIKWSILLGGNPYTVPVIGPDGTIYVNTWEDHKLVAITAGGKKKWEYVKEGANVKNEGIVFPPPVIGSDGTVYTGGSESDKKLYAITPNGIKKWDFVTPTLVRAIALGGDGTIYVSSESRGTTGLYALNPNGSQKSEFKPQKGLISAPNYIKIGIEGTIYAADNWMFRAFNPDGSQKWYSQELLYNIKSMSIGTDGTIYAGNGSILYAIGPDGNVKWKTDTEYATVQGWDITYPVKLTLGNVAIGPDGTIYATDFLNKDKKYKSNNVKYTLKGRNADGLVVWNFPDDVIITYPPAFGIDGTVYAVSGENLYALGTVGASSIILDKKALDLQAGGSALLTATIIPEKATNKQVKWSSSDSTVAAVDETGKVTGIAAGIAKITVTAEDGGFMAECVVTVAPTTNPPVTLPATPRPELPFSDIEGHWAKQNIIKAVELHVANGYQDFTFRPDGSVTRAEFAVFLMNGMKPAADGAKLAFTDQDKIGEWAVKAVSQALQLGIVSGYPDGTFRPDASITHAEMIAMVIRASGLPVNEQAQSGFADDADIPAWAKGAAAAAKQSGIADFMRDNRFAPDNKATRAEAVTAILNMLGKK
ncbi:S-layer homology domain-containing protein [Paenibacillus periandrae]|uniref:S-layer homology domain-containing protein n=1 Tax=Paenibacillus periandrae TaxID=1761741 RepID=UPI001F08F116|nr:S-layer homology domain-containing protein [Paenibacillus periandrae]